VATTPTIVTIPCFSGAPWQLEQLQPLADQDLRTMRLPDELDDIDAYVDFVADRVDGLDNYVLVGDSFGAVVAIGLAVRRPAGLRALVLSGGFAANPVDDPITKAKVASARFLPGPLYRQLVLRFHAASLASPHDAHGQVVWTKADSRRLFVDNTPHRSYVARAKAAFSADYRARLHRIDVPTLILTPSHDQLIGEDAARIMHEGIPDATEAVVTDTGHMFRFSHPHTYARVVRDFLQHHDLLAASGMNTTAAGVVA
jgi:pimeloyl-ACP methyl ester carboxylesterase